MMQKKVKTGAFGTLSGCIGVMRSKTHLLKEHMYSICKKVDWFSVNQRFMLPNHQTDYNSTCFIEINLKFAQD